MPIEKFSGVAVADIEDVSGVAAANIEDISGVDFSSQGQVTLFDVTWTFDGQNTTTSTSGNGWNPTGDMSGWASGTNACSDSGNRWAATQSANDGDLGTNRTATGFRIDFNGTGSGGTGPSGAHNGSGGHSTTSGTRYAYAETSGVLDTNRHFIARSPGYNYSTAMGDTSNNLDLKFYVHAYGSDIGTLKIYYDNLASSKSTSATLLVSCVGSNPSGFTGTLTNTAESHSQVSPASQSWTSNGSNWVQFTVSLNDIRTTNADHYIYFVYQGTTSFRGDLALDDIQIVEST